MLNSHNIYACNEISYQFLYIGLLFQMVSSFVNSTLQFNKKNLPLQQLQIWTGTIQLSFRIWNILVNCSLCSIAIWCCHTQHQTGWCHYSMSGFLLSFTSKWRIWNYFIAKISSSTTNQYVQLALMFIILQKSYHLHSNRRAQQCVASMIKFFFIKTRTQKQHDCSQHAS